MLFNNPTARSEAGECPADFGILALGSISRAKLRMCKRSGEGIQYLNAIQDARIRAIEKLRANPNNFLRNFVDRAVRRQIISALYPNEEIIMLLRKLNTPIAALDPPLQKIAEYLEGDMIKLTDQQVYQTFTDQQVYQVFYLIFY